MRTSENLIQPTEELLSSVPLKELCNVIEIPKPVSREIIK
jgi:hypothetical protein